MPQTEHLVYGSVPSTPRLQRATLDQRSSSLPPSSASSTHHIAGNPPKIIITEVTDQKKTPAHKTGNNVETKVVQEEKEEKKSDFSFRKEIQFTAFVFVCFILIVVIPLSMVIVGSVYIFDCPENIMIPIFLIVSGSTLLISIYGLHKFSKIIVTKGDKNCYKLTYWSSVVFQVLWLITGCFWTYGAHVPNYENEASPRYCNKTLYLYAFWLLNSFFIVIGLIIALFLIFIVFGRPSSKDVPYKV